MSGTPGIPDHVATMDGVAALPRENGTLVFAEPWEGRVVAMAVVLVERLGLPWDAFRDRLIEAIAQAPDRAYYESWAVALEALVTVQHLADADELDAAMPTTRPPL